jgi:conjugative transposon TraN protein
MKKFILPALAIFLLHVATAQTSLVLPKSTFILPYHLELGYDATTVLIFPACVKPGDKGKSDKEFIVQKQAGMDNVLKLKAARHGFTASNLHVFTTDGKVYVFDISYKEKPDQYSFDFNKLQTPADNSSADHGNIGILGGTPINNGQYVEFANAVKSDDPFFSVNARKYLMKLTLRSMYTVDHMIFLRIAVKNKSSLDYPIDFIRMYLADLHTSKRTSIQQTEIIPGYKDTLTSIPAHSEIDYVIAVSSFTIPDKKKVLLEMYELNGGRNITLSFRNKELFKSRPLKIPTYGK